MRAADGYAVVSCHVERLLDDRTWSLYSRLQKQTPGGFRIASLLRPPDEGAGEAVERWISRAREAADRAPIGHHTHWGGRERARPVNGKPEDRIRGEGAWLRTVGLEPSVFCGGGWYIDEQVAAVAAEFGYVDCTATAFRPTYLSAEQSQLILSGPCWLELPAGRRLLELPTTHSLGMLTRELLRRRSLDEPVVHLYFHDTDLLNRRRALALRAGLAFLARRRVATDLDHLAAEVRAQQLPVRSL